MQRDGLSTKIISPLLWLAVSVLVIAGCSSSPPVPDAQPMPSGHNFTGVWYSPQFEHMHLRQTGDKVSGIYTYKTGGRIRGEVDGNLLVFKWTEPGDKSKAQRTMQGSGYLQLVQRDGQVKLDGAWGYDNQRTGAGPWDAKWVRKLTPEDPLTLQDLAEAR